jgi:hypothetical protein
MDDAVKTVSVDTKHVDILKWDKAGLAIKFNPIRFKKLSKETLESLSDKTKAAYADAYAAFEKTQDEKYKPSDITIRPAAVSPQRRTEVIGGDDNYQYNWVDPQDQVRNQAMGMEVVTKHNDDCRTFATDAGSDRHFIGTIGEPTEILMREPKANYRARLKKAGDLSRQRDAGVISSGMAAIERAGVTAVSDDDKEAKGGKRHTKGV